MKKISLNVLDEYAKILTPTQVNKLYESKNHKQYDFVLNNNKDRYSLYLDAYTIANELNENYLDFAARFNEKYKDLMEKIYYKIDEEGIMYKTNDYKLYSRLLRNINYCGINKDILDEIKN